jgi:hypothetical protein
MRIQLKKDLPFGKRVIKAGRTITITTEKYLEMKKQGYFDDPIIKKEEKPKNDSQPKID